MWIIKNRVTGEYERKGMSGKRDKITRSAWSNLGRAKCHVVYGEFDEWFMDADFIEMTDEGIGEVVPVIDYLREYYRGNRYAPEWVLMRLGLMQDPEKEDHDA